MNSEQYLFPAMAAIREYIRARAEVMQEPIAPFNRKTIAHLIDNLLEIAAQIDNQERKDETI